MKHLFIINPHAGKYDRSHEVLDKAAQCMAGRRLEWEAVVTECPGHATELARNAVQSGGPVRLYACGGDGTLNEVAAGAAGFDNAAITHYPTGTGNDFIRMFGPQAVRFYSLGDLLDAPQAPMNLIDCNGRLALNICSVGFDARIGMDAAEFKKLPFVAGPMAYQLSVVKHLLLGVHRPYRVEVGGERFEEQFTLLCACNGRYYGGGFNPSPDAMPDDDLLHFVLVRGVSRLTVAALIRKYSQGRVAEIPGLAYLRQGREMKVTCDRVSEINLDGERMDADELSITLSAKTVHFFYPEGTHWNPALRSHF